MRAVGGPAAEPPTGSPLAQVFPTFHALAEQARERWRALPHSTQVRLLAVAILFLAWRVWLWYYQRHHLIAISDPDAEDYAQIALQLFRHRGLGSRTMPLCGLEFLRQHGANPAGGVVWPNLHRFPFMSLVEWGLFRHFGRAADYSLSLASGIFYIASVPLLFLLGQRVFSTRVALVGAVLYLCSPLALGASISGLTEQATTFFMMAVLLLLTGQRGRPALALAGLLWGISFWNRYTGAILALPFSLYIWAQDRPRWRGNVAAFLIPMAAAMAPEMLRNFRLAGDPMFSLTATLMVPFKSEIAPVVHWWYVPVYVKPAQLLLAWPMDMLGKWLHELYGGWRYLPQHTGLTHLYPFLLLSIFLRAETALQRRLRVLVLSLVGLHELTLPFLSNIVRYYAYISPLLILYATWGILTMADRVWPTLWASPGDDLAHPSAPPTHVGMRHRRRLMAGPRLFGRTLPAAIALLFLAGPMVIGWINLDVPHPRLDLTRSLVDTWRSHMNVVRSEVAPDEVVVSNAPWSIAWRADRKAVPLPAGPALLPLLENEYRLPIGAVYLTPRMIGSWETPNWRSWEEVRSGKAKIPGYRVAQSFRDGALLLVKDHGVPREHEAPTLLPEERD